MMRKRWLGTLLFLGLTASLVGSQERGASFDPNAASHVVYGDVAVEAPAGELDTTQALMITLQSAGGRVIGRDSVPPNGRYRFNDVGNGEFILVVEAGDRVISRQQFSIFSNQSTDVRKDVQLVLSPEDVTPVDPGFVYARSEEAQAQFDRAQKEAAEGDLKEAAELFEGVVEKDEKDYEAWTELGTVLFRREKLKEARKAYESALTSRPSFLVAMVNLGKVQLLQKDYEALIETMTKALAEDPARAEIHQLLGEGYLGLRKGSMAVDYLNEAIRLDPDEMAEVHLRLARLYDLAGMKDRAAAEYRAFLLKRPDWPQRKSLEEYIEKNSSSN